MGATSPANWLAHQTKTTRPAVHRAARLAKRLDQAHPEVDPALADAQVTLDQAQVIVEAVDALPDRPGRCSDGRAGEGVPARTGRPPRRHGPCGSSDDGCWRCWTPRPPTPRKPAAWQPRSKTRGRRPRSRSPMTATAAATAGSPSPPCTGRCSAKPCWRTRHPNATPTSGQHPHPAPARRRVLRVPRDPPRAHRPPLRRDRRHGSGHDDHRGADGRAEGGRPVRRHPDLRRGGPAAGLHRGDHPGRARRTLRTPRRRPTAPVPHQAAADRDGPPRRWLHRPRL